MGRIISTLALSAVCILSFGLDARAGVTAADIAKYDLASGESVYNKSCAACHTSGILKAPKTGVKADWTARLGQGMNTLVKKSIDGYTAEGNMPAKGGDAELTDKQVGDAVAYMVKQVL
ncbi:MAG: c-type cytochrome [Chlorobiales bacterium]|nr:c-type cytochrome [Chlorobiales bacterium]